MNSKSRGVPKVSVVVPNYNYAAFLDQRLRSIGEQTFGDFELIFLDDASTDNSVALVREKYGERIKEFIVNEANTGNPFVQWNRGVRLARGEYVWIAEADDFCDPAFLEKMVAVLDRNPSVGLAYCLTTPVDIRGGIIDAHSFDHYVSDLQSGRWMQDYVRPGADELRNALLFKNTITNVSGVLFRKRAYIDAGYAEEKLRMCGDWLSYCRMLSLSDVAFVRAPLNFHRQHPAKVTLNSVLSLTYFREYLQVQDYLLTHVSVGTDACEEAFRRFLGEWDRLTNSNYGRITVPRTIRTAQMAAASYRGIRRWVVIFFHLIRNLSVSVGAKWTAS